MKNSSISKLLVLGLVLFLGACSAAKGSFLKKVEWKFMFSDAEYTKYVGGFNSDGKKLDGYTFLEASDEHTGKYEKIDKRVTLTMIVKTTDGKTGSVTTSSSAPEIPNKTTKVWLKVTG